MRPFAFAAVLALAACATPGPTPVAAPRADPAAAATREEDVRAELQALADDSMQGRFTASAGEERASRYLAGMMRQIGLAPGIEGGDLQPFPVELAASARGTMPRLLESWADTQRVRPPQLGRSANVIGVIPGADPVLGRQVVLIDAHYDHLGTSSAGVCEAEGGDTVCNGADDDGSGVVAVLEIARELRRGPPPKRTVVFLLTSGEEVGLLGTRWYIGHPAFPLESMVANLEIEMIGRPDPMVGGAGKAWLTGFARSSMGPAFAQAGLPIAADPRPDQQFFERSDNIAFARRGIPAHTLSTFNLHADYHTPRDEAGRVDYAHMTAVIRTAARAARLLADGPAPAWKPGGRP